MAKLFSAAGQMMVYKGTLTLPPPAVSLGCQAYSGKTEVGVLGGNGLGDKLFFAKLSFQEWEVS